MKNEDLLQMLDLQGMAEESSSAAVEITAATGSPSSLASPTVLKLDAWSLRRGEELLHDSDRLKALPLDAHAVADFHAAAFDPEPQQHPTCEGQIVDTEGAS